MSRKWKLNVKRMAVCAMSASLLLAAEEIYDNVKKERI